MASTFVTVTTELEIPTLPNFIRTQTGESVPIRQLTWEQIDAIGQAWTKALHEKVANSKMANKDLDEGGIKVMA